MEFIPMHRSQPKLNARIEIGFMKIRHNLANYLPDSGSSLCCRCFEISALLQRFLAMGKIEGLHEPSYHPGGQKKRPTIFQAQQTIGYGFKSTLQNKCVYCIPHLIYEYSHPAAIPSVNKT